jgi:hypothetical protein
MYYFYGSILRRGKRHFFTPERPDKFWGSPNLLLNGYRFSRGVKLPGHVTDHSPPSSSKVKMVELYLYTTILLHDAMLN